jgi:hypothetical protein
MLRERKEDAAIIADTFRTAEHSVLTGAAAIAMCAAKMLELQARIRLPNRLGLDEVTKASRLSALMIEARAIVIELHPALAELATDDAVAFLFGDTDECPPVDRPATNLVRLRAA